MAANGEGKGQEKLDQFEFNLDEDIEEEGATMTLGDPNGEGHHRTMKLEGSIGQFPIKAMLDSGSTHCFLNPSIAQQLNLPLTQTKPLIVRPTAIDYSPTLCVRILNLSSKAIICRPESSGGGGLRHDLRDWLAGFGPMRIDWGKGVVGMEHKGERIELQAESQLAEAQVCEHVEEISKKKKKNPKLHLEFKQVEPQQAGF